MLDVIDRRPDECQPVNAPERAVVFHSFFPFMIVCRGILFVSHLFAFWMDVSSVRYEFEFPRTEAGRRLRSERGNGVRNHGAPELMSVVLSRALSERARSKQHIAEPKGDGLLNLCPRRNWYFVNELDVEVRRKIFVDFRRQCIVAANHDFLKLLQRSEELELRLEKKGPEATVNPPRSPIPLPLQFLSSQVQRWTDRRNTW